MSASSAAEAALINDAQFQRELELLAAADEQRCVAQPPGDVFESPRFADAFDALDSGLGDCPAPLPAVPERPDHPFAGPEPFVMPPAPPEPRVPYVVAALVLLACLAAGATAAVLVQPDPEGAISELTASR